jgi:hypothetical protein
MKTKNLKHAFVLLVLLCVLCISGCKKFLDINQNPNNPDNADASLLLPTAEAAVGQIVGNAFQIYGGIWSQYWTQSPNSSQYKTIDQYNLANTTFDRPWLTLYRNALINCNLIINSQGSSLEYMKGMAYILKAYSYQLTTDAFGDIPLTQALNPTLFGSPKYDSQALVYDSIFNYIDKGIAMLNVPSTSPGAQDIIFQGDIPSWKAFANTLKLRAYLRIIKADPAKAEAGIKALYATNPVFLNNDAVIKYSSIGGNENPLYNEMLALGKTQNLVASSTAVEAFKRNSDLRVNKFYDLADGQASLNSIIQGSFAATGVAKVVSLPSALTGGNPTNSNSATAPVKLMSKSESLFLQAEAAARSFSSGSVSTLLKAGVEASFVATGLTVADAGTYFSTAPDGQAALTAANTPEAIVKVIVTQKYFAMCGTQGFEAWCEYRRTGYPDFLITSVASTIGAGRTPLRLLYPSGEATSNANFPGNVLIYVPVWWDKP